MVALLLKVEACVWLEVTKQTFTSLPHVWNQMYSNTVCFNSVLVIRVYLFPFCLLCVKMLGVKESEPSALVLYLLRVKMLGIKESEYSALVLYCSYRCTCKYGKVRNEL